MSGRPAKSSERSSRVAEGPSPKIRVLVCESSACMSSKSSDIRAALDEAVARLGLAGAVEVGVTGCHGFCQKGPVVVVEPEGICFYCQVKSGDAGDLAASLLPGGEPVKRLFYRHPATKERIPRYADITFYKNQQRLILRNCGVNVKTFASAVRLL